MLSPQSRSQRAYRRGRRGSQVLEFGSALIILVGIVFLPLMDLSILPVRWMMAQEIVNDYSRQLALCESFGKSFQRMEADPSLKARLMHLGGIGVRSVQLQMRITRICNSNETLVVEKPSEIPPEWLPNGSKAPCSYSLIVQVNALLSPAVLLRASATNVPGVTAPFPVVIKSSYDWENFGRNPVTGRFFLNE